MGKGVEGRTEPEMSLENDRFFLNQEISYKN